RAMQAISQPLGVAYQACGTWVLTDANQDALADRPGSRNSAGLHLVQQLLVHTIRGSAKRQFPKCRKIRSREKVLQRPLGLFRYVYLPFFEPLDQIVGREINQFDSIGPIESAVGHSLAHADVRDLSHDVIKAFDVLYVDSRVDIDAAAQ